MLLLRDNHVEIRRSLLNIRNEIKAQIVRAGYTMQEVVDMLATEHG